MRSLFSLPILLTLFAAVLFFHSGCSRSLAVKARDLDQTRSGRIVERFNQEKIKFKRSSDSFSVTVKTTVDKFFQLLCPTREADWIPGWDCKLIYTESGYAEDKCIFTTDSGDHNGKVVWVFSGYKRNDYIDLTLFRKDYLTNMFITVADNKDGTVTGTWYLTHTALNENGNRVIEKMDNPESTQKNAHMIINKYLNHTDMSTEASDKLYRRFRDSEDKMLRFDRQFSGTYHTTVDVLFPLLCPTREADWIPGWDCRLIYTTSGYAEDNVVFTTDTGNSMGAGIWTFTNFKENEFIEFVRYSEDLLIQCKITVTDNGNGTSTVTWFPTMTALTEKGNTAIKAMKSSAGGGGGVTQMIEDYFRGNNKEKRSHRIH